MLARRFVIDTQAMHGVEDAQLVDDRVVFLPLGLADSTDKLSARFRQVRNGVPVVGGFVNVLMATDGRLLSVDVAGLPDLESVDTAPTVSAASASASAVAWFVEDVGLAPTFVGDPALVVAQVTRDGSRRGVLAWEVVASLEVPGVPSEAWLYRVDAWDGTLVQRGSLTANLDVTGTVRSNVTPGLFPHDDGDPQYVARPMPHMRIDWVHSTGSGSVNADASGDFSIPGVTASASDPVTLTIEYEGTWCEVTNGKTMGVGTGDYSLVQDLTQDAGNTVVLNPVASATQFTTAQANAYDWVNQMRSWFEAVSPSDTVPDISEASAVVNRDNPLNCTGKFNHNGPRLEFWKDNPGLCFNASFSTVVAHELGHWWLWLYNGLLPDDAPGFHEGVADVFSTYLTDQPNVAENYFLAMPVLRTGDNARRFCGPLNPLCYGQQHYEGEVLMAALWKVRARIQRSSGTSAGAIAADCLLNGWMNGYDDSQIGALVRTHWLTLDDTDGDLRTGTPHWADIDLGFDEQGFPRHAIMETGIEFDNIIVPGGSDSVVGDETGPYTVSADVVANLRPPISGAALHYRVNGGSFATVAMSSAGGDTYTGDIPGQDSPAVVELYLSADDTGNPNQTVEYPSTISVTLDGTYDADEGIYDPAEATPEYLRFFVGVKQVKFSDDFPTATVGSWTTNAGSDWGIGTPSGLGGETGQGIQWTDPPSVATGSYVWGNNSAGGPEYADGEFEDNWLRSPAVDLSGVGRTDRVYLLFQRWLTVDREDAPLDVSDRSEIRILDDNSEWQPIWKNHRRIPHVDSEWVDVELDISGLANDNSVLKVEWRLTPDGVAAGDTLGGWNIDDVEIFVIEALP